MDFAVDNGVAGISSQCGGACICALCHCFIAGDWHRRLGPISYEEEEMLEFIPNRRTNSRLSCQVMISEELEGMTIEIDPIEG